MEIAEPKLASSKFRGQVHGFVSALSNIRVKTDLGDAKTTITPKGGMVIDLTNLSQPNKLDPYTIYFDQVSGVDGLVIRIKGPASIGSDYLSPDSYVPIADGATYSIYETFVPASVEVAPPYAPAFVAVKDGDYANTICFKNRVTYDWYWHANERADFFYKFIGYIEAGVIYQDNPVLVNMKSALWFHTNGQGFYATKYLGYFDITDGHFYYGIPVVTGDQITVRNMFFADGAEKFDYTLAYLPYVSDAWNDSGFQGYYGPLGPSFGPHAATYQEITNACKGNSSPWKIISKSPKKEAVYFGSSSYVNKQYLIETP